MVASSSRDPLCPAQLRLARQYLVPFSVFLPQPPCISLVSARSKYHLVSSDFLFNSYEYLEVAVAEVEMRCENHPQIVSVFLEQHFQSARRQQQQPKI